MGREVGGPPPPAAPLDSRRHVSTWGHPSATLWGTSQRAPREVHRGLVISPVLAQTGGQRQGQLPPSTGRGSCSRVRSRAWWGRCGETGLLPGLAADAERVRPMITWSAGQAPHSVDRFMPAGCCVRRVGLLVIDEDHHGLWFLPTWPLSWTCRSWELARCAMLLGLTDPTRLWLICRSCRSALPPVSVRCGGDAIPRRCSWWSCKASFVVVRHSDSYREIAEAEHSWVPLSSFGSLVRAVGPFAYWSVAGFAEVADSFWTVHRCDSRRDQGSVALGDNLCSSGRNREGHRLGLGWPAACGYSRAWRSFRHGGGLHDPSGSLPSCFMCLPWSEDTPAPTPRSPSSGPSSPAMKRLDSSRSDVSGRASATSAPLLAPRPMQAPEQSRAEHRAACSASLANASLGMAL